MVLKAIYVVRHGFRGHFTLDHRTGIYATSVPTPTGIPTDPALVSYGIDQSAQLAAKNGVPALNPPVDVVYSSPFYRCLQTISPSVCALSDAGRGEGKIRVENGFGEFFGAAPFAHPEPAPLAELSRHFPGLIHDAYRPVMIPPPKGESVRELHNRIAYTLERVIADLDADEQQPGALLICTHAAAMIAMGRVLTGRMPESLDEDDFKCFTASISKYTRNDVAAVGKAGRRPGEETEQRTLKPASPMDVPATVEDWIGGNGIGGGWFCVMNGDCAHLKGGAERGWHFSGEESLIKSDDVLGNGRGTREGLATEEVGRSHKGDSKAASSRL